MADGNYSTLSNCESSLRTRNILFNTSPESGPIGVTVNLDSYHRPITASRDEPETNFKIHLASRLPFSQKIPRRGSLGFGVSHEDSLVSVFSLYSTQQSPITVARRIPLVPVMVWPWPLDTQLFSND